jgi:hypothetical protein
MKKIKYLLMILASAAYIIYGLYSTYFVPNSSFSCYYFKYGAGVFTDCFEVFVAFFILINPVGWVAIILMILGIRGMIKLKNLLSPVSPKQYNS